MWALSGWEHLVGFLSSVQRGQGLRGGQQVVAVKGKLVEMGQVSESPPRGAPCLLSPPSESLGTQAHLRR